MVWDRFFSWPTASIGSRDRPRTDVSSDKEIEMKMERMMWDKIESVALLEDAFRNMETGW